MRPAHLQECLEFADTGSAIDLLTALDTFVCDEAIHGLHPAAAELLCSGRLMALRKPGDVYLTDDAEDLFDWSAETPLDNSEPSPDCKVRPIAVGELLRRLIGNFVLRSHSVKRASRDLIPH